jgi:hypothetical protein
MDTEQTEQANRTLEQALVVIRRRPTRAGAFETASCDRLSNVAIGHSPGNEPTPLITVAIATEESQARRDLDVLVSGTELPEHA